MPRLINAERLWIVAPLFDVALVVPFTFRTATEWVLYTLFARLSWARIPTSGHRRARALSGVDDYRVDWLRRLVDPQSRRPIYVPR